MPLKRILIANRGEIAIRIAAAARQLGIEAVGVHPADDAAALHVKRVNHVRLLPDRGPRAYLDIEAIVAAATATGCDAVHPGYGFLSESAEFASACDQAGLIFVGAPARLLSLLGDKGAARAVARGVGAPVLPGIDAACSLTDVERFFGALPDDAGMMIKALSGGGGRGMRAVHRREDIAEAFEACRQEARLAFGSEDVYVEQHVRFARHIEVQMLGDIRGSVVHAGDRECSLQRLNQKVIEVAPSPALEAATRKAMIDAAERMARELSYRGLATFEFILDVDRPGAFYFMEVNPRIQVEHTVTEQVTGIDLVALQLQLAEGATLGELGLTTPPPVNGFAVQARVNLETMKADGTTATATGRITEYAPPRGPGIRVDDCLYTGYEANPSYDPLGAKVIATAATYQGAMSRLAQALEELHIRGVPTNRTLLLNLARSPEVLAGEATVSFIADHLDQLLTPLPSSDLHFGQFDVNASTIREVMEIPDGAIGLRAPTAGTVTSVRVHAGEEVGRGRVLLAVEAMKMEFPIEAPEAGVVLGTPIPQLGDVVAENQVLLVISPDQAVGDHSAEEQVAPAGTSALDELAVRLDALSDEARPEAVRARHNAGKQTIRENLSQLLDPDSFNEYGALAVAAQRARFSDEELRERSPADGLVAGTGRVTDPHGSGEGVDCVVLGYDYTVMAGSQGFVNHKKTDRMLKIARHHRMPVVLFAEGAGGRPSDTDYPAVAALDIPTFSNFARAAQVAPTIAIATGNCFAGNAALFGLSELTIATPRASIGMAGPVMIEGGGLGRFTPEEVGPARMHAASGVVDVLVETDAEAVDVARRYLSYFQGDHADWTAADQEPLAAIVPANRKRLYQMRELMDILFDEGSILELRAEFARSAITALARLEGRPVGVIANDPHFLGGAINADAGDKFARFLRLCSTHGLAIVSLCDTPGFMVGPAAEAEGTVRHVARMFLAGASLDVPIATVVTRKAFGLGAQSMAAGGFGNPALAVSWPTGTFGAMGIEGAVEIGARRELSAIADPEQRRLRFDELVEEEYRRGQALSVASFVEIDAVIDPRDTRGWVVRALWDKPRSSGRADRSQLDTW